MDLSGCKHPSHPDTCGDGCECICDACQERFEKAWDERVYEKNLCGACGTPNGTLSLELMMTFQYVHFFLPCDDCKERVEAFMKAEKLCMGCRGPLTDEPCKRCAAQSSSQ
jgi:hypothetical protein